MNTKPTKEAGEPDAVRVWRGYRAESFEQNTDEFYSALSRIFIPVTAQIMAPLGMIAYFPTILKSQDDTLADELALVFYLNQDTYRQASRETASGRAYGMLHSNVFSRKSTSSFPSFFAGSILTHTPYFLFKNSIHWREGKTQVYIGKIPVNTEEAKFLKDLTDKVMHFQEKTDTSVDGAIILVENGYVYYWEHTHKECNQNSLIPSLSTISTTHYTGTARPITVPNLESRQESIVDFTPDETLSVYTE